MATVTRENIGVLNDKIIVKVSKEDYLSSFEKSLKNYSKSASIPGFRKGMVPTGIIKKMHGQAVFTDEVLRTVEKELTKYMDDEKLDIFAQPLPLPENDARSLDVNNPQEYSFGFEVGLKPEFALPELSNEALPLYKVQPTDEMVEKQLENIRKAYGKKKTAEVAAGAENVANEGEENKPEGEEKAPAEGEGEENIELAELNEDLFKAAYPAKDIKTEEELREEIRKEIATYWEGQAKNHLQHEIYHRLIDKTEINFPETFLKRWLETGTENQKTAEEVEKEFPTFVNQLKWTLITDKIAKDQNLQVSADDVKEFAKKQLFGYMGMQMLGEEQPWVDDYLNRMMQDRKFVDDSFNRLMTEKIFEWAEGQVRKEEKEVSDEDFKKELEKHQHHH